MQNGKLVKLFFTAAVTALIITLLFVTIAFSQSPTTGVIIKNANLRAGPGTNFAVAGTAKQGQTVTIIGKNDAGTWYHLDTGQWIAVFLVNVTKNAPAGTPTATPKDSAKAQPNQTVTPHAATPTPAPTATPKASAGNVGIGQELHGNGWRFKVSAIHKRKAVYFYDNAYVAMGHFLVVIIDGTNEQSGTDYFARNIKPDLIDDSGQSFDQSPKGTAYAAWQYEGIAIDYTDVNPGNFVRLAMVFDVADNTGDLYLNTTLGKINLGNFTGMKSEDH